MNRMKHVIIINLLLLVTLSGCKNDLQKVDISDIELDVKIQRFDQELFSFDYDTVNEAVAYFYKKYGDFFDIFNVHVINVGPASQRLYPSYLSMFINDPQNREVYEYTQDKIRSLVEIEDELTNAFKRYLYYFPEQEVPQIIGYVSRFNHKLFTVDGYVGVGLDQYLGDDCPYYEMLRTPRYMQKNMYPGKIPSDVMNIWASSQYSYNDSVDNVLNQLIYKGMLMYFTEAMLPDSPDSTRFGFTADQVKFCKSNEEQMWTYLVEHKLLFSTDKLVIKRLADEAPNTYYFPKDSPGRASIWLGWKIVKEYARRNPDLTLSEIMEERDYQKILRESKYNPR